jgi:hypothetical protein
MNILILTPDAVGSTLLQRMMTIYMQFHQFDRPVINLHELTNGLASYYSPEFNRELVGKRTVKNWGYHQSLAEVVDLLSSVDHYKTSRLAHYHIRRRGDTIEQQIPFYKYLNENFYIVSCRRANVFEHAVSMTLNHVTKKLNVYSAHEKIDTFYEMYHSGVELDTSAFVNQLNAYRQYIKWSEQYFNISSYFNYEQDVPRIEEYILNLPVFAGQPEKITWNKNFGISFNSWNKIHYACSDINQIINRQQHVRSWLQSNDNANEKKYHTISSVSNIRNLPRLAKDQTPVVTNIKSDIELFKNASTELFLEGARRQYFLDHKNNYNRATHTINQMIQLGIIISGPPIKKQTLSEKRKIIKNFDKLIEVYNLWAEQNLDICSLIFDNDIATKSSEELNFWHNFESTSIAISK